MKPLGRTQPSRLRLLSVLLCSGCLRACEWDRSFIANGVAIRSSETSSNILQASSLSSDDGITNVDHGSGDDVECLSRKVVVNFHKVPACLLKPKHQGQGLAVLALSRNMMMAEIKVTLWSLFKTMSTKFRAKVGKRQLEKKDKFEDVRLFPAAELQIKAPPPGAKPVTAAPATRVGQDHVEPENHLSIPGLLQKIAQDCSFSSEKAHIRIPLFFTLKLTEEQLAHRQFNCMLPHFVHHKLHEAHLLVVVDRQWCGMAVDRIVRHHLKDQNVTILHNGAPLPPEEDLTDSNKYPQATISLKANVSVLASR